MMLRSEVKKSSVLKETLSHENREQNRKIETLRIVCRYLVVDSLKQRGDIEFMTNIFFENFQKIDSAALIIQRCWRRRKILKNEKIPKSEKEIITKAPSLVTQIVGNLGADMITGLIDPLSHKQVKDSILRIIKEMRNTLNYSFESYKKHNEQMIFSAKEAIEKSLTRARRFGSTQTELHQVDIETQTERITGIRKK